MTRDFNSNINEQALPSVCICMISYNDAKVIKDALDSIFMQEYPVDKLSVIVVDGGSTDGTLDIIRKTPAQLLSRPDLKEMPYQRGELAMSIPDAEILIALSADNRFLEKDAVRKLVTPFHDPEIAGAGTYRYGHRRSDPALCRYFALIGGGDPVAIALGTADRSPYDVEGWSLRGTAQDCGTYYKLTFDPDPSRIPTLGFNGFAFRKAHLDKIGGIKYALHMEACVQLVKAGYKFAMTKDAHIVHLLGDNLISSLRRRIRWARLYSADNLPRTYHVFHPNKDGIRISLIALYFLTVFLPLGRSVKGYLRFRDPAWFLHPWVGLAFVYTYSIMFIQSLIDKSAFFRLLRPSTRPTC